MVWYVAGGMGGRVVCAERKSGVTPAAAERLQSTKYATDICVRTRLQQRQVTGMVAHPLSSIPGLGRRLPYGDKFKGAGFPLKGTVG